MAKPIDIATHTRALTADSSDNLVVTNELQVSTIDTTDSSAITVIPAATFNSDVTVENNLQIKNNVVDASGQTLLPSTLGTANYVLKVNAAGTGAEWALDGGAGTARTEEFPTVTNGSANVTMGAAYTLSQLDVYLNGARMRATTDYTVSSTTLTFAENLSTGDIVALYAYDTAENLITGNWNDLDDVNVTGATTDAMVRYNGSAWVVGQTTEDSSGNLTVAGQLNVGTLDTTDSSAINVTPAVVFNSDVNVENSLRVNKITSTDSSALAVQIATQFSSDVTVDHDVTASRYFGDGSNLTGISAGATGGGTDQVFYENDQTVTANYSITENRNAMTAGPITINSGVTVTIPTGSEWSIV